MTIIRLSVIGQIRSDCDPALNIFLGGQRSNLLDVRQQSQALATINHHKCSSNDPPAPTKAAQLQHTRST